LSSYQDTEINLERIQVLIREARSSKSVQPFMSYPGLITCGKALLEAYIKGDDLETISNKIFF